MTQFLPALALAATLTLSAATRAEPPAGKLAEPAEPSPKQGLAKPRLDYQKIAEQSDWRWAQEEANALYSVGQSSSKHNIAIVSGPPHGRLLTFKVLDGERELYAWKGHHASVFRLVGDRLYYAGFDLASPGGSIVAVDVSTGKELWRSKLHPPGYPGHSAYYNMMTMNVNDEVVSVYVNEARARYFEIKDIKTGETVGFKEFEDDGTYWGPRRPGERPPRPAANAAPPGERESTKPRR